MGFFQYYLKEEYHTPALRNRKNGLNWPLVDRFYPDFFPSLVTTIQLLKLTISKEEIIGMAHYIAFNADVSDGHQWLSMEETRIRQFLSERKTLP